MKLLSVKFVVFHQLVALAEGRGMDGATRCFAKGRRLRISIIEGESLEKTNMLLQSKFRRRSPLWSCAVATDWAARHAQGFGGAALEAHLHGDQSGLCSKINGAIRLRSRSRWSDPSTSGENGISDDLLSIVGSREHGLVTWKYKIVARTCCAQWEDVGPFQIDHWQYVFGNERPRPNANCDAGIDVSPAVRDYLGMSGMDVCDWKFVSVYEVTGGPWRLYGDNDTITHLRRQTALEIPGQ